MENNQSLEFRTENLEREIVALREVADALIADSLESAGEFEKRLLTIQNVIVRIVAEKFAGIEGTIVNSVIERLNNDIAAYTSLRPDGQEN